MSKPKPRSDWAALPADKRRALNKALFAALVAAEGRGLRPSELRAETGDPRSNEAIRMKLLGWRDRDQITALAARGDGAWVALVTELPDTANRLLGARRPHASTVATLGGHQSRFNRQERKVLAGWLRGVA